MRPRSLRRSGERSTTLATAIVTGSGGLIGSESVRHLIESGYRVIGIENDMRSQFFGESASTRHVSERLEAQVGGGGVRGGGVGNPHPPGGAGRFSGNSAGPGDRG